MFGMLVFIAVVFACVSQVERRRQGRYQHALGRSEKEKKKTLKNSVLDGLEDHHKRRRTLQSMREEEMRKRKKGSYVVYSVDEQQYCCSMKKIK